MNKLNKLLQDLDISKVKLSRYLGVSRQMIYNYLESETLEKMPSDKKIKLFNLLEINDLNDIDSMDINHEYSMRVEKKLTSSYNENIRILPDNTNNNLTGSKRKIFDKIYNFILEKLNDDNSDESLITFEYLYNFLQSMDSSKELKYILAYVSKSAGFTDPCDYKFNEEQQFIFESILYSGMSLYNNGGASRSKIADTHRRWENEIEHKKEEALSRTQQLNTAKAQALRELGYKEINEDNASEVLEKIAEIQSRQII